jgi:8-oxo-dGTP pyrophosphatase MutT (NUDIX family)
MYPIGEKSSLKHSRKLRIAAFLRNQPWIMRTLYYPWRLIQPRFTIGVVGVLFNPNRQVLLVEHVFHPLTPWGLPGGWVGRREDPADTLTREIREELALVATTGPVVLAQLPRPGHLDMAYLCQSDGAIGAMSSELLAYKWFPPDDLPKISPFHDLAIRRALQMLELEQVS